MCWSKEVSAISWIIGTIGSLLLYKKDKVFGAFFLFVSQMQLIDMLLWITYENNNLDMNVLISKIGVILNNLQPIVLWLGMKNPPEFLSNSGYLYSLIALYFTRKQIVEMKPSVVTEVSAPHLNWDWIKDSDSTDNFYMYVYTLFMTIGVYANSKSITLSSIPYISGATSSIVYGHKNVTGSLWCFFTVAVPWAMVILN